MNPTGRYHKTRKALLFWCLFIGIGALAGATGMLSAPDGSNMGMQALLPYFQVLPLAKYLFQDFVFPGIALLCVNGIPNIIAAILLIRKKKAGVVLGTVLGGTLMAWILIQFVIFPANALSIAYFIFGTIQLLTGLVALIFYQQEHFLVEESAYPNVGTNPALLTVYFSRMGYTKKAALEEANRTGAVLYEIKSTERTQGTLGFWWCGRFAMHRWDMPIEAPALELEKFQQVTICTPIWAFHIAAPVRTFCKAAKGRVQNVRYVLVHFNDAAYQSAAREMDGLLGVTAEQVVSICTRQGRVVKRAQLRGSEGAV